MRAVLQRVRRASVDVDGEVVGAIGAGLCVLVGVTHADTEASAQKLADKIWRLRIFADEAGQMNLAASDLGLPVLVVSQFTLYADTSKGRRPSWQGAAPGPVAEPLVLAFSAALRDLGASVQTGVFGASMQVELVNDGPMTLILEA
jgi:D-aminoacyl-tRNA deacylase